MAHEVEFKYNRKLSDNQVRQLRQDYLDGVTQRQLSMEYGISLKTVYSIIHLLTYQYVQAPKDYLTKVEELSARKRGK